MTDWGALSEELEMWRDSNRSASFWWRDDDSECADPGIGALLALRRKLGVPLAVAVIPAAVDEGFAAAVKQEPDVCVLQHGVTHRNHAAPGHKKSELSGNRTRRALLEELGAGKRRLEELFGDRFLPVLVPPWNRIHEGWIPELSRLGYRGLSRAMARAAEYAAPGIKAANVHVDVIDWRGTRGFVGTERALDQLVAHLRARRQADGDADEPTGILTHHLVDDGAAWSFVAELVARTAGQRQGRWLTAEQLFQNAA